MANMIARLGVVLGLDSAEFSKGLEAAGRKLEQFSEAAEKAGKIGATALVAATVAAVRYADELADVAQANEVAIGTVLKLSDALANNGGKADNAGKMLSAFTKFIDDAAGGSEQAQKTAAKLGVSLKDLGTLSQEELLNKFVKNIAAVEDPITRGAKSMEVFSKAAKGVDMVGFGEAMAEANRITQEQEEAIKNAAEMYDVLAQSARNTMLVIATEVGPTLKAFADYIKELNGETNDFGNAFKIVFQTVAVVAANVLYVVKTIFGEIYAIGKYIDNLINKNWATAEAENDAYIKKTIKERAALDAFEASVMNPSAASSPSSSAPRPSGRAVTDAAEKERQRKAEAAEKERLRALERYRRELQKQDKIRTEWAQKEAESFVDTVLRIESDARALKTKEDILNLEIATKDMRSEDIALVKELYLAEQKRLENVQEIQRNTLLDADTKKYLIDKENELANATERYLRAQNQAVKAQRDGTYKDGMVKQAQKFLRDMPTELEMGAKAFDSLMGNMESAIDKFVRTGKASFKDLAKSIIQDILAMQMKAMASRFLSSLFGSDMSQPAAVMGMPGYADGGSPAVGQVSVVGERGPELFVPRTSGTIIPNHALAGVGGTTNVTNNYINAIDTKSFEDRLLSSSNAIWAANKYGEKNLATNFGRT
jgi:lambda family phage tail tape measure protein